MMFYLHKMGSLIYLILPELLLHFALYLDMFGVHNISFDQFFYSLLLMFFHIFSFFLLSISGFMFFYMNILMISSCPCTHEHY